MIIPTLSSEIQLRQERQAAASAAFTVLLRERRKLTFSEIQEALKGVVEVNGDCALLIAPDAAIATDLSDELAEAIVWAEELDLHIRLSWDGGISLAIEHRPDAPVWEDLEIATTPPTDGVLRKVPVWFEWC